MQALLAHLILLHLILFTHPCTLSHLCLFFMHGGDRQTAAATIKIIDHSYRTQTVHHAFMPASIGRMECDLCVPAAFLSIAGEETRLSWK